MSWDRTLSKIGSLFGRIVYLASLRNENTGKYEHFRPRPDLLGNTMRIWCSGKATKSPFREWLAYPLEPQKRDLEQYLESLDTERQTVLDAWVTVTPYRRLVPARATQAEQELYVSDLELILTLLRSETSSSP